MTRRAGGLLPDSSRVPVLSFRGILARMGHQSKGGAWRRPRLRRARLNGRALLLGSSEIRWEDPHEETLV